MGSTKNVVISVTPEFDTILEQIDELVLETKTNRSAIIRAILYEFFETPEPTPRPTDMTATAKKRQGDKQ